jgi:transcription elongation GreA/GreB family factor
MQLPDKRRILQGLVEHMTADAVQTAQVAEVTRRDATHEEARPENDKDTRALEQTYLARGQAMRAEKMIEEREVLRYMSLPTLGGEDAICAGALVVLEDEDGSTRTVFLVPHGGGVELRVDGVDVQVVTPTSSLGKAILGRAEGDEAVVTVRGKRRELNIVAVR